MFNSLHEECGVFGIFESKTSYTYNTIRNFNRFE